MAPLNSIQGEAGSCLQLTMNVAAAWVDAAIGDMCVLDTTADWTVADTTQDTAPWGKIISLNGTAGTDQTAVVEVFGRTAVRRFVSTAAAIVVGEGLQVAAATGQAVETTGQTATASQPQALNADAGVGGVTIYAVI